MHLYVTRLPYQQIANSWKLEITSSVFSDIHYDEIIKVDVSFALYIIDLEMRMEAGPTTRLADL